MDPVITASFVTHGCSEDKMFLPKDSNCLGISKEQQAHSGVIILIIGASLFLLEISVPLLSDDHA